jgi:ABC-type transport system involved in multi-copper enzyme maturation permease subunit
LFSSLWAITRNSFIEIIRQPVYVILLAAAVLLTGVSPYITMFGAGNAEQIMVDMGLATMLLLGLVMGVLNASQVIHRQIERRTAGAIMSKPVGRLVFLVGQFLAVTAATALAIFVITVVLLQALRLGVQLRAGMKLDWPAVLGIGLPLVLATFMGAFSNFFYRLNFCSTTVMTAFVLYILSGALMFVVSSNWMIAPYHVTSVLVNLRHLDQVAIAALLVFLGVWVLSTFAVALSTRLNAVLSALTTAVVFFLCLVAQFLLSPVSDTMVAVPLLETMTTTRASVGEAMADSQWELKQHIQNYDVVQDVREETVFTVQGREASVAEIYNEAIEIEVTEESVDRSVVVLRLSPHEELTSDELATDALTAIGFDPQQDYNPDEVNIWPRYPWLGRVMPHLYVFWVSDKLMTEDPIIPWSYVSLASLYALGNCLGLLALAAYLFEGRDLV